MSDHLTRLEAIRIVQDMLLEVEAERSASAKVAELEAKLADPEHLLHRVWTFCVGKSGYVKAEWQAVRRQVEQAIQKGGSHLHCKRDSLEARVKELEAKENRLWQLLECADRATNRAASTGRAAEAKVAELEAELAATRQSLRERNELVGQLKADRDRGVRACFRIREERDARQRDATNLAHALRNIADACSNCRTFDELQEMARQALAGETAADREPCDSCTLDAAQARVKELEAERDAALESLEEEKAITGRQIDIIADLQERLDASRKAWPRRFRVIRGGEVVDALAFPNGTAAYVAGIWELATADIGPIQWIDDPPEEKP